ncbi:MAG: hypothetical protein HY094_06865 [Candidatus Melainabacteria bacterium]|nr:hypothetical protein [Candidatus Melainabacteria bacterium]
MTPKNPLTLTCEKITQTPRVFNTAQIKNAIENISLIDVEEKVTPELLIKIIEYILKDFFLYMHQTGLYNRQFKLWKTMGNITQCSISKLQGGIFKKNDLNTYIIDFFIDPKSPCLCAIVNEGTKAESLSMYENFKSSLSKTLYGINPDRVKGVFYFFNAMPDKEFITKLDFMTNAFDPISKYEAMLSDIKDTRLNIINFKCENEKYSFQHVYPEIRKLETKNKV